MEKLEKSYFFKNFRATVGKAINDYKLIDDNDRILVGFSGGKDSLALFDVLNDRLKVVPINYTLIPVFVYPGEFPETISKVEKFFEGQYNKSIIVKKTNIKNEIINNLKKENPCFYCARIRRKILFQLAYDLKCNKLALGHNMDDVNETLFLNILYSGDLTTMLPKQKLFDGSLTIIRPLIYLTEEKILKYVNLKNLPLIEKKCTYKGKSDKREIVKNFINSLQMKNKKIKKNIAAAIKKGIFTKEYNL